MTNSEIGIFLTWPTGFFVSAGLDCVFSPELDDDASSDAFCGIGFGGGGGADILVYGFKDAMYLIRLVGTVEAYRLCIPSLDLLIFWG